MYSESSLKRMYNKLTTYFPKDMPKNVNIHIADLQVSQMLHDGHHDGIDINGVTVSNSSGITIYLNSFLARYPSIFELLLAHEMCHVWCKYKLFATGNQVWAESHGDKFREIAKYISSKGLSGVKVEQDLVKLPHSYYVVRGHTSNGYIYLRLEGLDELTMKVLSQFSKKVDTTKPYHIGEMSNSIIGVFPFVRNGSISGEFVNYTGEESYFKMDNVTAYSWEGGTIEG